MTYTKRSDSRKFDELRKIEAKVGIIKRADGSAMFRIGDTVVIAAVYGPRELYPGFLQNPETGILRCTYDMLSFSVTDRKRPGPSRRSVEISLVTEKALSAAIDLTAFPNTVVDVFIMVIQADSGTRCAGITAASMALADAGIPMRDLVSAIAVGKVGDKIVVDLTKEEEDYEEGSTDIPIAVMPRSGEITLLQLDGEVSKEELLEAIRLAKESCNKINQIQIKALKEKYMGSKNEQ